MSDEFKIQLLSYLTGTLESETGGLYNTFKDNYITQTNILEDYDNDGVVKCVKQVVSPNNVGVMWNILALWSNTLQKGRFVILDEFNQIVSIIDEYTSGADIGCYYGLELDEKGRLYGIEYLPGDDRVRFIMLNNITVPRDTYYADIRRAYNVPTLNDRTPVKNESGIAYLTKISNYAKYCIVVYNTSNWLGNIYTFEIGEEGATTWKEQLVMGGFFTLQKPFIEYNDNNMFSSRIVGITPDTDIPFILRISYTETDNEITRTYDNIGTEANGYISQPTDIIWIDVSNIIVPFTNTTKDKLILQKINIDTEETFTKKYEKLCPSYQLQVLFTKTNNYDYMYLMGRTYNQQGYDNGYRESVSRIYDIDFSHLQNAENIEEYVIKEVLPNDPDIPNWTPKNYFIVQNQYNLYNCMYDYFDTEDNVKYYYTGVVQQVYNENNYNGSPYTDTNCLIGRQMLLKNIEDDEKILLARNVYNITTTNNISNYFLDIPNFMLNTTTINQIDMLGETNLLLDEIYEDITKNKYEELILVINNQINMINNNNTSNPKNMMNQAIRLNNSITTETPSMNNTKIDSVKINYSDNTSEKIYTTNTTNGMEANISVEIEVSKEISSIEFINYNTEYSYLTITPNLEIGKTYTISQDVRIGD